MPRQARQRALESAILGKIRDGELTVLTEFDQAEPKTKDARQTLHNLKVDGNCLVVIDEPSPALWKSLRNLPGIDLATCSDLNAYSVLRRKNLLLTRAALEALSGRTPAKEAS
jgi:large subunit ribosomal protein L4